MSASVVIAAQTSADKALIGPPKCGSHSARNASRSHAQITLMQPTPWLARTARIPRKSSGLRLGHPVGHAGGWRKKEPLGSKFRPICGHWRKRASNRPSRLSIFHFSGATRRQHGGKSGGHYASGRQGSWRTGDGVRRAKHHVLV